MFCPRCGKAVADSVKFCGSCGCNVNNPSVSMAPPAPQSVNANNGKIRTTEEMLCAAGKYKPINPDLFRPAFDEVVKALRPDEYAVCVFTGSSAQRRNNSMLWFVGVAVTNQRLIIGGQIKGWVNITYTAQSFNIDNINAISQTWSMIGGDLIIDTLGDDIRIGETSRDAANAIIKDMEAALYMVKTQKHNAASAVVQQFSPADELKKFKELLDMGAISQEEFDNQKRRLLGL